ncbi:MAG: VCBS repeat-containing protein [Clostridium sp.]|nr:VCBS repeat-containing protein [Clostridium sp.]
MKKNYSKKAIMLLAPLAMVGAAQAQVSFQRAERFTPENQEVTLPGHEEPSTYEVWQAFSEGGFPTIGFYRGCPVVGDFNNDGKPDYYVSGQIGGTQKLVLPYNYVIGGWRATSAVYASKADGYDAFFGGYDSYAANENVFTSMGLPFTANAYARFVDLDNDGNLDFVICSGQDYDTSWPYADEEKDREGKFFHVYRNLGAAGGYQFERVRDLPFVLSPNDGRDSDGWEVNNSISFGDYNNDGLVDVVYQGVEKTRDENGNDKNTRFVNLYKNLGDFKFELANVADPVPYEENYNTEAGIFDVEFDESDPLADPVATPNYRFRPLSNSGIQFGDFDNDGFLDLVYTGWEDGIGASVAMYRNTGDGRFQELKVLNEKYPDSPFIGLQDKGDLVLADMNNDGLLDIVLTGSSNVGGDKRCDIYFNAGNFEFERVSYSDDMDSNIHGVSNCCMQIADFNNDGLNDVIVRGHGFSSGNTPQENWDWHAWVYTQTESGGFDVAMDNPNGLNQDAMNGGGFVICDWNGDGKLDVVSSNGNDNSRTDIYLGNSENEATVPTVPANVTVKVDENGKIVVSWDAASDASCESAGLIYNVYVKDNETGKTSMLIPADVETGKLKVYTDVQVGVRSDEETLSKTFVLPTGHYTVGVSAINPALNASAFATETIQTVGIRDAQAATAQVSVTSTPNGVIVNGAEGEAVNVYNAAGKLVATGVCGKEINVKGAGVCIVKCAEQSAKIVK